jgi:hypothetical protein
MCTERERRRERHPNTLCAHSATPATHATHATLGRGGGERGRAARLREHLVDGVGGEGVFDGEHGGADDAGTLSGGRGDDAQIGGGQRQ